MGICKILHGILSLIKAHTSLEGNLGRPWITPCYHIAALFIPHYRKLLYQKPSENPRLWCNIVDLPGPGPGTLTKLRLVSHWILYYLEQCREEPSTEWWNEQNSITNFILDIEHVKKSTNPLESTKYGWLGHSFMESPSPVWWRDLIKPGLTNSPWSGVDSWVH